MRFPYQERSSSAVRLHHAPDSKVAALIQADCPSLFGPKAHYRPCFALRGPHLPVVFGALANFSKVDPVEYERRYIQLTDSGTIALDFSPPFNAAECDDRPVVLMIHGLSGSSQESYMRNMVAAAVSEGWRCVVLNQRGCGQPAYVTSAKLYHGAQIDDIRNVLLYINHLLPASSVYAIAFSLGANVLTNLLGSDGEATCIKAAVMVSSPWDCLKTSRSLESTRIGRFYSKAMARNQRAILQSNKIWFQDDPRLQWEKLTTAKKQMLSQFDDACTAKLGGYRNVDDYYRSARCTNRIHGVKIPVLAINAVHDPITALDRETMKNIAANPNVVLAETMHGGHLGWFKGFDALWSKKRWLPRPVMEFLLAYHRTNPTPKVVRQQTVTSDDGTTRDKQYPCLGFKEVSVASVISAAKRGDTGSPNFHQDGVVRSTII